MKPAWVEQTTHLVFPPSVSSKYDASTTHGGTGGPALLPDAADGCSVTVRTEMSKRGAGHKSAQQVGAGHKSAQQVGAGQQVGASHKSVSKLTEATHKGRSEVLVL